MFSRSQVAGNATLASLNSMFHSPMSPTKSRLRSLDASTPGVHFYTDDDFQSNMTYHVSAGHSVSSSATATGLGIFYPSIGNGRTGAQEETGGFKGTSYELPYRQRNVMRTDSVYDAEIATGLIREPFPDPFTLSSLLVSTDFLRDDLDFLSDEPVIESALESTPSVVVQESRATTPVDEQGRWVLQRILEASGHTVESLSIELRNCFGESVLQTNAACTLNGPLRNPRDSPVLGINPAVIMPLQPQHEGLSSAPPPETPDLGPADGGDSEAEQTCISPVPAPVLLTAPEQLGLPVLLADQFLEELEEAILPYKKESDYEPSLTPSAESSPESAFMPTFSRRKIRTRSSKALRRQSVKRILTSPYTIPSDPIVGETMVPDFSINYGTPVLDAHRGLELSELKAKAARYRERNQGIEYDKKWLLSFAGKLTPQGLMTEEYRCYIIGCNQSNRRRDHILIHVGGHLDQRPFACTHCPARFLRKNECKRHELSHTGARPFACDICPLGATAFVRQDLLKRHQKRTHNMDNNRGRTGKRHRQI